MIPTTQKNRSLQFRVPAFIALIVIAILPYGGTGYSSCPSNWLLQISCPACGLTRSMNAILHMDIAQSLVYHPLGWLTLSWIVLTLLTNNVRAVHNIIEKISPSLRHWFSFKALAIAFIIVWLIRLYYYQRLLFI